MGIRVKESLSMSYVVTNILSEEALREARDYFYAHIDHIQWYHQNYNLFDVERLDIPGKLTENRGQAKFLDELKDFSRLDEFTGCYFLRYNEGSFARLHQDANSAMTIITQIETSDDLVGGLPIIRRVYEHRERPSYKLAKRHEGEEKEPPYGKNMIYDYIVEMEDGKSAVYDDSLYHGVSYIHSGYRIILATWFNRGNSNELS